MRPQDACQECVSLWREYAEATRNHVALLKEQEGVAGINIDRFRELETLVEQASERRD
jgi:hypothetical protein